MSLASSKFKMRMLLIHTIVVLLLSTQAWAKKVECKTTMKGKKAET